MRRVDDVCKHGTGTAFCLETGSHLIRRAVDEVERGSSVASFRMARLRLFEEMRAAGFPSERGAGVWHRAVNRLHDRIIAKTIEMAIADILAEGGGPPPVRYAFILFGSGGRREQTLGSDQDNGLVYADPPPGRREETERYFRRLGERIVHLLSEAGYPPCEGNVTARNPLWRRSLSEWRCALDAWASEGSIDSVRLLLIAADGRVVHGDAALAGEWGRGLYEAIRSRCDIRRLIIPQSLRYKPALGVAGNVLVGRYGPSAGKVNIKYGLYLPIIGPIRALALMAGIRETSTRGRVHKLQQLHLLGDHGRESWDAMLGAVLYFRTRAVWEHSDGGVGLAGQLLAWRGLPQEQKKRLKAVLAAVRGAQREIARTAPVRTEALNGTGKER